MPIRSRLIGPAVHAGMTRRESRPHHFLPLGTAYAAAMTVLFKTAIISSGSPGSERGTPGVTAPAFNRGMSQLAQFRDAIGRLHESLFLQPGAIAGNFVRRNGLPQQIALVANHHPQVFSVAVGQIQNCQNRQTAALFFIVNKVRCRIWTVWKWRDLKKSIGEMVAVADRSRKCSAIANRGVSKCETPRRKPQGRWPSTRMRVIELAGKLLANLVPVKLRSLKRTMRVKLAGL